RSPQGPSRGGREVGCGLYADAAAAGSPGSQRTATGPALGGSGQSAHGGSSIQGGVRSHERAASDTRSTEHGAAVPSQFPCDPTRRDGFVNVRFKARCTVGGSPQPPKFQVRSIAWIQSQL